MLSAERWNALFLSFCSPSVLGILVYRFQATKLVERARDSRANFGEKCKHSLLFFRRVHCIYCSEQRYLFTTIRRRLVNFLILTAINSHRGCTDHSSNLRFYTPLDETLDVFSFNSCTSTKFRCVGARGDSFLNANKFQQQQRYTQPF